MFRHVSRSMVALLSGAMLLALVGADADKPTVSIKSLQYDPQTITIKTGQTVTWTNADDRDHTVIGEEKSFRSGNLSPGDTYSYTFKKAGKYKYGCRYHPRMKGVVVVTE